MKPPLKKNGFSSTPRLIIRGYTWLLSRAMFHTITIHRYSINIPWNNPLIIPYIFHHNHIDIHIDTPFRFILNIHIHTYSIHIPFISPFTEQVLPCLEFHLPGFCLCFCPAGGIELETAFLHRLQETITIITGTRMVPQNSWLNSCQMPNYRFTINPMVIIYIYILCFDHPNHHILFFNSGWITRKSYGDFEKSSTRNSPSMDR